MFVFLVSNHFDFAAIYLANLVLGAIRVVNLSEATRALPWGRACFLAVLG